MYYNIIHLENQYRFLRDDDCVTIRSSLTLTVLIIVYKFFRAVVQLKRLFLLTIVQSLAIIQIQNITTLNIYGSGYYILSVHTIINILMNRSESAVIYQTVDGIYYKFGQKPIKIIIKVRDNNILIFYSINYYEADCEK